VSAQEGQMTTVINPRTHMPVDGKVSGWWLIGILRIAFGWTWLWAFADKLIGLGYGTCASVNDAGEKVIQIGCDAAFINGGSPTYEVLNVGTAGSALGNWFTWMAPSAPNAQNVTDWVFMIALLLIGLPFILGAGTRLSGIGGALLYLVMYLATSVPPADNPLTNEHILGALTMLAVVFLNGGVYIGIGRWWQGRRFVKRRPYLK